MTVFALPAARSASGHRPSSRRRPRLRIGLFCVLTLAAGLAACALPAAAAGVDPQLALLLRFMAALKGAVVLGALGLACWRLRAPVTSATVFGYAAALAAMSTAPGLIWSLGHVAAGAASFHAGALGFAVVALRDDALADLTRGMLRRGA